jgi:NADH:ubiquinone oxidoreductase subunit H
MAIDKVEVAMSILKMLIVIVGLLQVTPIMVWIERRGSALIQDRIGPNRIGPFGLIQSFADALKFVLKEDVIPAQAHKWLYTLAPLFGLLPALTTIAVIPWGEPFLLPGTVSSGSFLSTVGWITAGLLLFGGLFVGAGAARFQTVPRVSRLNAFIWWALTAGLVLGAFALGALLIGLRAKSPIDLPFGGYVFNPIVTDTEVGVLVVFALASLSVYGLVTAGWASANKFSLFGGIRASAQMISYELALTLSAISALMVGGSLRLTDIVEAQRGSFLLFGTIHWPAWNCFSPAMWMSMIVFIVAAFAETNRLPFDFAEAEAELVAGYHTEYSSMKFALFFMSEYMAMAAISALTVTLFFGGWDIPFWHEPATWWSSLLTMGAFLLKVTFCLLVFVWVRWTIPRLKYDLLMKLGWKVFLPMAVLNVVLVAFFIMKRWI